MVKYIAIPLLFRNMQDNARLASFFDFVGTFSFTVGSQESSADHCLRFRPDARTPKPDSTRAAGRHKLLKRPEVAGLTAQ